MGGLVSLEVYRLVARGLDLYNRYRAPEARATLLSFDGEKLVVRFEGSFCETCGINDWVEDLVYVLRDVGLEAELVDVIEPEDPLSPEQWRIGVFRVGKKAERGESPSGLHDDLEDGALA